MEIGIDFFKKKQATQKEVEPEPKEKEEGVALLPPLEKLEQDAYAVRFFSPILDDHFVVFKKEYYARTLREFPDDILYYEKEMWNLIRLAADPEELRLIHAVKRIFDEGCWLTKVNLENQGKND